MKRALDEMVVTGVDTNIGFQKEILNNESFLMNKIDTSFIDREIFRKKS